MCIKCVILKYHASYAGLMAKILPKTQPRVLLVKPADRFLGAEFVYSQLGPNYLQSFLKENGIDSDLLVLYEPDTVGKEREAGLDEERLDQLRMLHLKADGTSQDIGFEPQLFAGYDIVGLSVMTPQAPDAYRLSALLNEHFPRLTTVIGGSHARYYRDEVLNLDDRVRFDFVVPQDGWKPMLDIVTGAVVPAEKAVELSDKMVKLTDLPAPTRPLALMQRYDFGIGGVPAWHTITALGCPFSCNFCESAYENVRPFSEEMLRRDLETMAQAHRDLGHEKYGLMIFDDVGLMNPRQVENLSRLVKETGFSTWRAVTHPFLVKKFGEDLLGPFVATGGERVGIGLETGSQFTLDLINKRNGQKQFVEEHYEAVGIANRLGVAVDGFTMIYPFENEGDLQDTTKMLRWIAGNEVKGIDAAGRPRQNHMDATIMAPYRGTPFRAIFEELEDAKAPETSALLKSFNGEQIARLSNVRLKRNLDPGQMWYKGKSGSSGWPYAATVLPRERYEEEQKLRNS